MTGERHKLLVEGVYPYCAMMQVAAEDTHCNYVVCRGYDTRDRRYYDYAEGDAAQPGIAVAKPYWSRFVGVYRIGQGYPAVLPLSSGAEDDGKIVPRIGQNPGRVEGNECRGNPLTLEEEIVLLADENGVYISWMLLDGGPGKVYFELRAELVQWSGDIVDAARKTWDPTADGGKGGYTVPDCADTIKVGDLNEIGHNAGVEGYGSGIMHERENEPYWVCVIDDLCCPGDEQGSCDV